MVPPITKLHPSSPIYTPSISVKKLTLLDVQLEATALKTLKQGRKNLTNHLGGAHDIDLIKVSSQKDVTMAFLEVKKNMIDGSTKIEGAQRVPLMDTLPGEKKLS
jgi:hypothetical protein